MKEGSEDKLPYPPWVRKNFVTLLRDSADSSFQIRKYYVSFFALAVSSRLDFTIIRANAHIDTNPY